MAMIGPRARRPGQDLFRPDDGNPIHGLFAAGDPIDGSAVADFILANAATNINGLGGDDLVLGDVGLFFSDTTSSNNSFAQAINLDNIDAWTVQENPLVADDSVPHAQAYVMAAAGGQEYFRIFIPVDETITIDMDGGGGALGGADDNNMIVELFRFDDLVNPFVSNDDSAVTNGGYGSLQGPSAGVSRDSFLTFTAGIAGIYYIRISKSDDGAVTDFSGGEEFLLNVSLTGHEVGAGLAQNADFISGGDGDDVLLGAGGADSIFGGAGADRLDGGSGSDTLYYYFSALFSGMSVTVNLATGVASGGEAASDIFVNFENIQSGWGSDILTGDANANILSSDRGSDILDGGGGADTMIGGADDDLYYVDNAGDAIGGESASDPLGGNDRVNASISYVLTPGASVETLATANQAGAGLLDLTGNEFANRIEGNEGANTLSGAGGNDTLFGFGGTDFLIGGTDNDSLFGGDGADNLRGGDGDDILNGGAAGDDLRGDVGNDTYIVDTQLDAPIEYLGEGDDTILASVSFLLAEGYSIEAVSTTNQAGTAAIQFTGNDFAQSIFGNEGNNQLLGFGGTDQLTGYGGNDVLVGGGGIDYMRGGLGNDVYGIDENDVILENAGEGDDSLAANVGSYFLNDDASIETLSTANQAGTFAQNLTGNNFAQSVAGSEGANVLNGRLGNDLLRGYGGADIFLFDTAPGASNHDVIADMQLGADKIALQNAVFTGLAEGNLGANAFRAGTAAQDADDRIIWDAATNQLFFDADGNGAGAAMLFAIVNGSPNLQATDFIIV